MEVCDVVLRQQPPVWFSSSASVRELQSSSSCCRLGLVGRRFFCDEGYLKYYCKSEKQGGAMVKDKGLKKMEKMEKKKKKQLKLLKGLSRDLSTFSQIGFGLDCDQTLVDQIKGNNISSAAELLLDQLQKIKAENKELKKRRKEEKKKLKGARLEDRLNKCEMSSSSSGSSSSDSECGEVIDMKSLKRAASTAQMNQIVELPAIEEPTSLSSPALSIPFDSFPQSQLPLPDQNAPLPLELSAPSVEDECCSVIDRSCVSVANVSSLDNTSTAVSKKIEVCMGGKCKKTGAAALLEEFQRAVGIEGAVSGCKCMGKCREGPNVRVLNEMDGKVEDKKAKSSSNPLCIGVSMEDVDMIVANFLGENENQNQHQLEFAA